MKLIRILSAVLLVSLVSACAKTTVVSESVSSNVEVIYTQPTERAYEELGLVSTQTGQTLLHDRSNEGMIIKLQEKAYELGADAIILKSLDESTWGLTGDRSTGFEKGKAVGIAIKFKE